MTKDSAALALELASKVRYMVNMGDSDEAIASAIRMSWFARSYAKESVVDTLSGMAVFAQRENVTFNCDALVAQAIHMGKELMT